ncbi:hypothetical protein [Streptomyces sp. NBC_00199]|uniref:hypothetical protein n=1 Tax=Streptomyces sp. NBC_00199 TaxID=2975678 RepID=UPI00225A157D|nr:hypothetical protein [Streptomyces sp. NBC_00199]MCX5266067.1 hypothetical protein [Streptomyces sp. NBC_00199]
MSAEQLAADVFAVLLAVIVAGFPLGYWTRRTRPARHADRALLRLARRRIPVHAPANDERHPDYCHRCGGFCGSKAHR